MQMADNQDQPIFIMSSERSGSNLLRTLFSNHSNLAAPTAPHFLNFLHKLIPFYGPLTVEANARALFDDMLTIVNHPNYLWDLDIDFEVVHARYRPQCFMDFFDLFYRADARRQGKGRFVCKENNLFDFAFHLIDHYPEAKFVYLVRDPRDYVASFMKVPVTFGTPFRAAVNWRDEQEKCDSLIHTFGLQAYCVRYKDLIMNTERVMSELLSFVGEPVEEACFEVQSGKNEGLDWNVYWQNLSRPIIKTNAGKYQQQFDDQTIRMIETVTRDQLIKLGYDLDTPADWKQPPFFRYRDMLARKFARARSTRKYAETYQVIVDREALIRSIFAERKRAWLRDQELRSQQ